MLNFESNIKNAFSAEDEQFVKTLAGQAVLAIRNAQSYEREHRLAAEREGLIKVGAEMIRAEQLDPVFEVILDKALEITDSGYGTLMLYNKDDEQMVMAAQRGAQKNRSEARHSLDRGVVGKAARNKEVINVGDVLLPEWCDIYLPYIPGMRSELAVPMIDEELRGVINIESPEP